MQFLNLLEPDNPELILVQVLTISAKVGVPLALVNRVPHLPATRAFRIGPLLHFEPVSLPLEVLVLGPVLVKAAARLVQGSFPAAPPHGAAPLRRVRATRPLEVLFLGEFLIALLTDFEHFLGGLLAHGLRIIDHHDHFEL